MTPRTLEDIQRDYVQLCTKAGDLQYKISAFKSDLDVLNKQLRDLNFEAIALQDAENQAKADAAKAAEVVPAAEVKGV